MLLQHRRNPPNLARRPGSSTACPLLKNPRSFKLTTNPSGVTLITTSCLRISVLIAASSCRCSAAKSTAEAGGGDPVAVLFAATSTGCNPAAACAGTFEAALSSATFCPWNAPSC